MARKKQVWRYTKAQRQHILETARKEKLSGAQVQKRFGISMWTYYSWRSPARGIHAKARPKVAEKQNGIADDNADIRSAVRAQIQQVLPGVIREEVEAYVTEILGGRRGPGRPRTRF